MEKKIIARIFLKYNLEKATSVQKIKIGFTNEVYSVNDKFILKVCADKNNEKNFAREKFFYDFFRGKIPVPKIRVYDNSKKIYHRLFMIYPLIQGDNLYARWHRLSNPERKNIIRQLVRILKIINQAPCAKFIKKFRLNPKVNWRDQIIRQINNSLVKIKKRKLLSSALIKTIKDFADGNHHVLAEQKIALVYWDAHFDNIIIRNKRIVGILDFERTVLSSLDFVLDVVKRMTEYPKKYMAAAQEKFARKKDYARLPDWFKEFYPGLFKFKNLDRRLALYALAHDLDTLLDWPKSREVKHMIAKTVHYHGRGV